jgi:biotin-(acetyl-CoA carboxylase) ligase
VYLADGFAPFQAEYEAANVLLGKVIRFSEGAGKPHVQGRVLSLGADGKLNVEVAPSGEVRGFLSGEVSGVELAPGQLVEGAAAEE